MIKPAQEPASNLRVDPCRLACLSKFSAVSCLEYKMHTRTYFLFLHLLLEEQSWTTVPSIVAILQHLLLCYLLHIVKVNYGHSSVPRCTVQEAFERTLCKLTLHSLHHRDALAAAVVSRN